MDRTGVYTYRGVTNAQRVVSYIYRTDTGCIIKSIITFV